MFSCVKVGSHVLSVEMSLSYLNFVRIDMENKSSKDAYRQIQRREVKQQGDRNNKPFDETNTHTIATNCLH